jgi:hypothetical protein
MQLRRRDVEKWMSHRRLPEDLRRFLYRTYLANLYHTFSSKNINLASMFQCLMHPFAIIMTSSNADMVVFHD